MATPLTAQTLAHDVVRTCREGSYLADDVLEKVIYAVLLDALDAREGQTCGTCRHFMRDGDEEAVVPTGWCRDTHDQPMQHSTTHAQFGCNQWTPKEPVS